MNITVFPRDEKGKVDVEKSVDDTNNQPKREIFKYEQEGWFCLGGDKVESKEDGIITGKPCPVFDYRGGNFHLRCLQKRNLKLFFNNMEAYLVVVTMGQKYENRKYMALCICRKNKGNRKSGRSKNE